MNTARKISISLFIMLVFVSAVFAQNEYNWEEISQDRSEVYFKFHYKDKEELNKISRIISIDDVRDNLAFAYANKTGFSKFLELEMEFELLTPPGLLNKNPQMMDLSSWRNANDWDYYPTYNAYLDMMQQFEQDYPDICKTVNLGTLSSGRKIMAVRITDNLMAHENEPEFFYTSSMHGDELTGYVLMLRLIDHLLSHYGNDSRITDMINGMEIWINPLANPDGTYAGGNNTVYGATRGNANGIDFNRNFPDPEDGPHPDGNPWQEETIIFMDFAEMHDFVLSCNIHGGAEVCNYPWDTWWTRHADDAWWQFVCREYADTVHLYGPPGYLTDLNNGITNGYDWYTISGGRQDYMNYFQQCREFTLEISNTKTPLGSELPDYWDYNYRSLLNYIEQSTYGIRGIVTDSISGEEIEAQLFIPNHDKDSSMVFSSLPVGNYYRPIYSGTYDLQFSAPGYYNKTLKNVSAANYGTTVRNVQLAPETIIADFLADPEFVGTGSTADFFDQSYGEPTGWKWEFEGGEPFISSEENPTTIHYADTGSFDVKLTIYKENDSSMLLKEDYIDVDYHYMMDNGQHAACSGLFFDSGENENYANDEDYVLTFLPSDTQDNVIAAFIMFDVEFEENCENDWLSIYDGLDVNAPLIGTYCGTDSPGVLVSTNEAGALTFAFHSNNTITSPGWIARLKCINNVGAGEEAAKTSISVYPNPANEDIIHIRSDSEIHRIRLVQLNGALIRYIKVKDISFDLNLQDLPGGIYILEMQGNKILAREKLIIH